MASSTFKIENSPPPVGSSFRLAQAKGLADPKAATPQPRAAEVDTRPPRPPAEPLWRDLESALWAYNDEPTRRMESHRAIASLVSRFAKPEDQEAGQFVFLLMVSGSERARDYLDKETQAIRKGSLWDKRLRKILERVNDPLLPDQKISNQDDALSNLSLVDPDHDKRLRFPEIDFLKRRNLELNLDVFKRNYGDKTVPDGQSFRFGYRPYSVFEYTYVIGDANHRLFDLGSPYVLSFNIEISKDPAGKGNQIKITNFIFTKDVQVYERPAQRLYDFDPASVPLEKKFLFAESNDSFFLKSAGLTLGPGRPLTFIHRGENRERVSGIWNFKSRRESPPSAFGDPRFDLEDLFRHASQQLRAVSQNQFQTFAEYFLELTRFHEGHHQAQFSGVPIGVMIYHGMVDALDVSDAAAPVPQLIEFLSNIAFLSEIMKLPESAKREGLGLTRLLLDVQAWTGGNLAPGALIPSVSNLAGVILLKNAAVESDIIKFNYEACRTDLHSVERIVKAYFSEFEEKFIWPHVAKHLVRRSYIQENAAESLRIKTAKEFVQQLIDAKQKSTRTSAMLAGGNVWYTILLDMKLNGHLVALQQEAAGDVAPLQQRFSQALGLAGKSRAEFLGAAISKLLENSKAKKP